MQEKDLAKFTQKLTKNLIFPSKQLKSESDVVLNIQFNKMIKLSSNTI